MALWKADGTASGKVDWASKPDQLMFRSKVPTWALENSSCNFLSLVLNPLDGFKNGEINLRIRFDGQVYFLESLS